MKSASWLQTILRSRRKRANRETARQHRAALFPSLFVRELEDRRVLSVDTVPWVEPFRHLVLDASPPADDGAADSFHLAAESEALQAAMDDQPTEAVHLSTVSAVRVEVADGVDALRIDFSSSGPNGGEFTVSVAENTLHAIVDDSLIATHSLDGIQSLYLTGVVGQNDVVTLDFGNNPDLLTLSTIHVDLEGDASDDLVVISDGQAVRVDYTDVSSGKITIGATSVVFTGLGENTLTVGGTDNLTLTFSDTAENIVFTNHEDAGDSQVSYQVGDDSFTTTFANPATSLTVYLGNNGQTATFTSLDAAFNPTAGVTINGGTGDDTITITSLGTDFTGALAVDGGDGTDSVTFNAVLSLGSLNVTAETIPVSGASLTTSGGNIDLNGNLTLLGANLVLSTGTEAGNIQIGSITGGSNDLQLISGSGTTTVTGSATGLGTLTLQENAATSTGAVSFQGGLTATTLTTFAHPYSVSLAGGSSTITNAVTFNNTAALTLGDDAGDSTAFTGGVTALDPSTKNIAGTISAEGTGGINLGTTGVTVTASATVGGTSTGALTLGSTTIQDGATLTVGAGAATAVNLGSVSGITGGAASHLTINTAGAVTVGGAVGTDIGTVTVTNSGGTTFQSTVNAATVTLTGTAADQTVAFQGNLTATSGLTAAAGAYNVSITGSSNSIAGATTFSNTGTLTLGDGAGDSTSFTGGVTATAPSTKNIAGTISTAGTGVINLGATGVSVTATATVGGTSTGAITLGNATIQNGVTLTVGAGAATAVNLGSVSGITGGAASHLTINTAGAVTVGGAVGTDIGTVTVTNSGGTTFQSTVNAATVTLTSTAADQTVAFQGNLTATSGLTAAAGAYNVSITGTSNSIAGATTFSNTGGVTLGDGDGDSTRFTGGVTSSAGTTNVHGTVNTTNADATFGALTLGGNSVISTGMGAGNIQIASISGGNNDLQLVSGNGTTKVTGAATGLGTLTLQQNTGNPTGTVWFQGDLSAASLTTFARNYQVSLTGSSTTITGATTFLNGGMLTLGDEADDVTAFTGGVTVTAPSSVSLAGTISATGTGVINLGTSGVTVTASATVGGTSTGAITLGNATIQDGATLTVGTGAATPVNLGTVSGVADGAASHLTINTAGAVTVGGAVGTDIGAVTVTNSGGTTFQSTVTAATVTLTSTAADQTVAFQGNLTATSGLTAAAGAYNVSITGTSNAIAGATSFSNSGGVVLGDEATDTINFLAGPTVISSGTMTVIGVVLAVDGLNVHGTATLAGTGTINGRVTTAGSASVSPGPATGILTINNGANAALELGAGTTFTAQVNGATPGTEHDQLKVTGTVDLIEAVLNTSGSIASIPGQVIVLIDNDGSDPVTGTFADKPEGSVLTINGIGFVISYKGGSQGNDVVLIEPDDATYVGTSGDDSFLLQQVIDNGAHYIELYRNNVLVDRSLANTVTSITIDGLDGSDTLTVNYGASGGFFSRDITFNGDDPNESPGDGLVVIGGTFTTTTYNFTEIAEGNVILVTESSGTATITYTGLESVINNSTSGDIVFNLRDLENQDVTLVDNTDPGLMDLTGSTFTDVTFAAPTTSLTIHGGSLADSFAVTSVDSAFRASLIIDGGGSDTIHLNTDLTLGSATSAGNLTLTAETIRVSADSIATNAGAVAGNVSFNGLLILGGNVTIAAGTGSVKFGGAVAIGPHDLTVASSTATEVSAGITGSTGSVDINATAATNVAGAIALSDAGTVTLDRAMINGVDITTVGGTIMFDGPTSTDSGEVAIGTGAGAGHVAFNDTLTLGGNVTITAGAGNVSFDGTVVIGTRNLAVVSSSSTNVSAGITGSTGDVNLSATAATNVDGAIALSGAGTVRLDRAVISGANVTTVGGAITLDGPASTDTGPVVIGTGAGGGSVDFNGTLTLGGNMAITAGTGNVDLDGAVSIGTYDLTVVSSSSTNMRAGISGSTGSVDVNATAATNVDAAIALSGAGTVRLGRAVIRGVNVTTVGGTITFDGPAGTDTGPVEIDTGAGAGHVAFNGALTLGGNLAITAGAGNVDFDGAVSIGTHDLTVVSSASTTMSSGISGSTSNIYINATAATNVDGAIALSDAGTVRLGRAVISGVGITTVGGAITFDGPASTDEGPVGIGTGAGDGYILFHGTLGLGGNLMVTAGTGDATFSGAVTVGEHDLTVVSSTIATVAAGISGTTGSLDIAAATRTDVDGAIALTGAGNIELDRAALSGVDVTTAGGNITFDGPVSTDTGAVAVGTGTGGGHVLFNDTLDLGGNLTVAAGTGDVAFSGAVTVGGHNLTVTSSTITTVAAGISGTTGNVDIAAAIRTDVDGAIALTGAGNIELEQAVVSGVDVTTERGTITFNGPASTGSDDVEVNAGEGGGDVLFKDTLELGANLTIVAGGVQFNGTVDSRTGSPRSFEVRAGNGGVVFGGSVGDGGSGRELGNLTVQTTGVLSIPDGGILRTSTSLISKLPLQLSVDEKDPFGSGGDRVQRLVGIAKGTSVLFVQWADADEPGASQTVNGGDEIQLFTSETGVDQWKVPIPGDGSGPIIMTELAHEYPIAFLFQHLIGENRNDLRVLVTLTSDESIRLEGRATADSEIRNLASTTAEAVSILPAGQFTFAPQAVQFQTPVPLLPITTESRPVEVRANGPTIVRAEEIQTAVEVTSTATRELVIVKVGPLGEEGDPHLLPEDALEHLEGLFERFVQEGLPNGRYRIYLREIGFPPRKLLEFYKSGRSIGDPVREPGPGSNPLAPDADFDADAAPEHEAEAAESAGTEGPSAAESVDAVPSEARTEETDGTLHPLTTAVAIAASAAWQAGRTRDRWPTKVKQAMEQAEPQRFTRGARWRRLVEGGNNHLVADPKPASEN